MLMLFMLRIKEILSFRAMLVLVLICPLLFGLIASMALGQKALSISIACLDLDMSDESEELCEALAGNGTFKLVITDSDEEAQRLVETRKVEGVLRINEGFSEGLYSGGHNLLVYSAAPGSQSAGIVSESVSLAVSGLRSERMLYESLELIQEGLGEEGEIAYQNYVNSEPVLSLVYHGGDAVRADYTVSPKHGLAAIFIIISALFFMLQSKADNGRIVFALGGKKAVADYFTKALAVSAVCLFAAAAYLAACSLIYGSLPGAHDVFAFACLVFLSIAWGAAISAVFADNAVYFCTFFVFLNLTAGGALWGKISSVAVLDFVLPSALFEQLVCKNLNAAIIMLVETVIMLALSVCGHGCLRKRRHIIK